MTVGRVPPDFELAVTPSPNELRHFEYSQIAFPSMKLDERILIAAAISQLSTSNPDYSLTQESAKSRPNSSRQPVCGELLFSRKFGHVSRLRRVKTRYSLLIFSAEDIFNRYNRLAEGRLLPGEGSQEIAAEWPPLANISETDSEYLIKAELREVEKKNVNMAVNDSVITIKGELRLEKDSEDEMQHRIESFYGSSSRGFSLPADVDESGIRAESNNGVLKVHLPKTEVQQPKSIKNKVK